MKYITTPIYYVNDAPHIGHAFTTLAADVLARFWRLKGEEVFFLTGTDEHGAKIAQAAQGARVTPQALADKVSSQFQTAWRDLAVVPDGFIRTTDPKHKRFVEGFFESLLERGLIYKGEYKGWYCLGCEEFKTESEIGEKKECPIHLTRLRKVAEEAYLFKLPQFAPRLRQIIIKGELKIEPASRKNEVLGFLDQGLREIAVSRQHVRWGIPVPGDPDQTIYVWFDALLNYLSATAPEGPVFPAGKRPVRPPTIQIIGKDILRFHAVIWPALLLAAGQPLPDQLFVHGYLTVNGQKMSKSLRNVIRPDDLIARYGAEATRYLLLAAVPFGADGDITLERLDALYTSNLANNLGNLVSRVQALLSLDGAGKVPTGDRTVLAAITQEKTAYDQALASFNLSEGLGRIVAYATSLNRLIEKAQPWGETNRPKREAILASLAENLVALGGIIAPVLPETGAAILGLFGLSLRESRTSTGQIDYDRLGARPLAAGKTIKPIPPLFPRLA